MDPTKSGIKIEKGESTSLQIFLVGVLKLRSHFLVQSKMLVVLHE